MSEEVKEYDRSKILDLLQQTEIELHEAKKEMNELRYMVRKLSDERCKILGLDSTEEYNKLLNKHVTKKNTMTPVLETELQSRVALALIRNRIEYIEQLDGMSERQVMGFYGIGRTYFNDIMKVAKLRNIQIV